MTWWSRLIHRKHLEKQLHSELQFHLEQQIADNCRAGMTNKEAHRQATLQFGGIEQIKENCRDARGTRWLEATVQDVRFAWRTLSKNPGFSIAAICTLALGIGANTAIFSVINSVILRPLPYREPERLVAVNEQFKATRQNFAFSYPDFLDCQRMSRSFESIAAVRNQAVNITSPGEPEYIRGRQVSAGFLAVLGITPLLGREFLPEEDRRGVAPVAVISYSLWQQRFGGNEKAIGSTLVVNGKAHTVVGILPKHFRFRDDREVLVPIGQDETVGTQKRDLYSGIYPVARLKQNVSVEQANAELETIAAQLAQEYPSSRSMTFGAEPLKQQVIGDIRPTLFLLAGALGLVLLIACVNVANLFLVRSLARKREFAIRAALGAGQRRLLRQLLAESLLLSTIGGALGFALAATTTGWTLKSLPFWLPRTEEISLDVHVLLFTSVVSLLAGVIFCIAPAIRQSINLESALRLGARGSQQGIQRLQSSFVVLQFALALVLLVGAGLMMRTVLQLWSVNPGFDPKRLLVMTVGLSPKVVSSPTLTRTAWNQIVERVQSTPGIEVTALDSLLPLTGDNQSIAYWTTAETAAPKDAPYAVAYSPTRDYLRLMKIPLLRGRFFTEQDKLGSQPVIVIDEVLAKRVFPDKDPVGQQLSMQLMGRVRIIGVVGSIKHQSLDEDAYGQRRPAIYVPFLQLPDAFMPMTQNGMNLLVRTAVDPATVIAAVKQSVYGPTRDQPVRNVMTMEQIIGNSIAKRRGMLLLLGIFAGVALLLAAIGIYSVISYSINQRVQEIGIRMALGARPGQVMSLITRQAMLMVLIGVALGGIASILLARLLTKVLYGVSPADPVTFAAVVMTLGIVAFAAIWFPARRAARLDPTLALRYE